MKSGGNDGDVPRAIGPQETLQLTGAWGSRAGEPELVRRIPTRNCPISIVYMLFCAAPSLRAAGSGTARPGGNKAGTPQHTGLHCWLDSSASV